MLDNNKVLKYLSGATIYEVNLRQYTEKGDIPSFIEHLPRLKKMGVDIIWLMPIHPIGIHNRKGTLGSYYSSRDFFDLNPEYGTKADFSNLVAMVHQLDMKIIIDWVANHAAWDNSWTLTNPEYFVRDAAGNFLSPYDWSDVIQVDHNNEAAHDAMRSAMCYWVREFDIDGFRADLAHLTPLRFWVKARQVTETFKPDLIWLAETEEPDFYQAFDIVYAWRWMHRAETFFKENLKIDALLEVLQHEIQIYPSNALQLFFTTNHDENSWNGTEYEKYGMYAKALAVFSFFYPSSVPLIYSGQEIPNYKRLQFFDKDELEWNQVLQLDDFYSTLIHCRKNYKSGNDFSIIRLHDKLLAFKKGFGSGSILVFINLDAEKINFSYAHDEDKGVYQNIFNEQSRLDKDVIDVELGPGDFLVLEKIK